MCAARSLVCMLALALIVAAGALASNARAAQPAVVELFTSQGCSSCPPADRLLAQLARNRELIVLSLPVDYWDRLGWKDTFAQHAFTERQVGYAKLRGDGQVYTPQAVVNGQLHAVGSARAQIEAAVAETSPGTSVPVMAQRRGSELVITVGAAPGIATSHATITLLPILASREVAIGRGENAHHKVTYTNIVRDIVPVGEWSGAPVTRSVPLQRYQEYDGVVVLLQEGSLSHPGAILGADQIALR